MSQGAFSAGRPVGVGKIGAAPVGIGRNGKNPVNLSKNEAKWGCGAVCEGAVRRGTARWGNVAGRRNVVGHIKRDA